MGLPGAQEQQGRTRRTAEQPNPPEAPAIERHPRHGNAFRIQRGRADGDGFRCVQAGHEDSVIVETRKPSPWRARRPSPVSRHPHTAPHSFFERVRSVAQTSACRAPREHGLDHLAWVTITMAKSFVF